MRETGQPQVRELGWGSGSAAEMAAGLGGAQRVQQPGLVAAAKVAALAREAGGLGDGPVSRAGLQPLLGRLFGPRPVTQEEGEEEAGGWGRCCGW